ncbi:MAG TPA: glycerol kinase GlpK [Burkholderiales bacterium]|nr:glycerol kinase GlpK [Burkholderiales bacterium]
MSTHILALDQGTTSSRAILFDKAGRIVAMAQKEFRQIFPQPGWVEHDPEEIWQTQLVVAQEVLFKARVSAKNVAAIGITNQRETTMVWHRASGKPVANAIVWQDRRTAKRCDNLKREGKEAMIRAKTGLVVDPYFSGTKISWLLDHVQGARDMAEAGELAFGTVDSWLIWKLTGGNPAKGALHVTDVTNASRTLLYNIHTDDWDDTLCLALNVPPTVLPHVVKSSEVVGQTHPDIFGAPVPIAGIAGDQQAALFGQGATSAGLAKNTYGTGCFMLMHTGEQALESKSGLITTAAARTGAEKTYALEGSVFIAGAVVQWLRDSLGIIKSSAEVEALAASVESSEGVIFVPAFVGLGAPYWDAQARGALSGLTRGSNKAHIARAALESIAFQSAEVLHAMETDSGIKLTELRVDGGAATNQLLMQFQADLLGVPVVRPKVLETTALGAAYLAGLAVGYWKDLSEIAALWEKDLVFEPRMGRDEAQARLADWNAAVARVRSQASLSPDPA